MKKSSFAVLGVLLLVSGAITADEGTSSDVAVETIEPFHYAAIEMTGSYDQHREAFQTLYEQLPAQGISQQEAPFGIYYDDPAQVPLENLKWEIGIALPEEKELKKPLTLKRWPYATLVTVEYEGPFTDTGMGAIFGKLFGWMEAHNYSAAGPVMQKFLSEMTQNSQGQWVGKVKVLIPATKN